MTPENISASEARRSLFATPIYRAPLRDATFTDASIGAEIKRRGI